MLLIPNIIILQSCILFAKDTRFVYCLFSVIRSHLSSPRICLPLLLAKYQFFISNDECQIISESSRYLIYPVLQFQGVQDRNPRLCFGVDNDGEFVKQPLSLCDLLKILGKMWKLSLCCLKSSLLQTEASWWEKSLVNVFSSVISCDSCSWSPWMWHGKMSMDNWEKVVVKTSFCCPYSSFAFRFLISLIQVVEITAGPGKNSGKKWSKMNKSKISEYKQLQDL